MIEKKMKTWLKLFRSYNKIRRKEINFIESHKITMNQFQILEALYHKGNLNIASIIKLTMGTPGNVTVVIKNLKKNGYIITIKDENDNRNHIQSITEKGKKIIEEIFPEHKNNFNEYFKGLSENEIEILYELLDKLQKNQ